MRKVFVVIGILVMVGVIVAVILYFANPTVTIGEDIIITPDVIEVQELDVVLTEVQEDEGKIIRNGSDIKVVKGKAKKKIEKKAEGDILDVAVVSDITDIKEGKYEPEAKADVQTMEKDIIAEVKVKKEKVIKYYPAIFSCHGEDCHTVDKINLNNGGTK